MEKRIKTSDIKIGMFIKRVDSSWLSSPFLMTNFLVESPKEIKKLADYNIDYVFVDMEKSRMRAEAPHKPDNCAGRPLSPGDTFEISLESLPVNCKLPVDLYRKKDGKLEHIFKAGLSFGLEAERHLKNITGATALCPVKQKPVFDSFVNSLNEQKESGFDGPYLDKEHVQKHLNFMKKFFAINPVTLLSGEGTTFDVFEKVEFDVKIVLEKGVPLKRSFKENWIENDTNLLIDKSDREGYKGYLKENKNKAQGNEKAAFVREDSRLIMESLAENPRSETLMRETKQSVVDLTSVVFENPTTFYGLMKINNYDYYTFTHSVNVATMSVALGMAAGVKDQEELSSLGLGAMLHDLGKSKVDSSLINKPGRLTEEEYKEVTKHVVLGKEILEENQSVSELAMIPLMQHHEKLSGKGYPLGLHGDEVHTFGRISAIIDVYDALTTERAYRKAMLPFDALALLSKGMGDDYDEKLFALFVKLLRAQETGV